MSIGEADSKSKPGVPPNDCLKLGLVVLRLTVWCTDATLSVIGKPTQKSNDSSFSCSGGDILES